MIRRLRLPILGALTLACVVGAPPLNATSRVRAAVAALEAAGFPFDADVRFRIDPHAVCQGIACADVVVISDRRTILLAPESLRSDSVLRATLLEIWERYREPRPGAQRDLARGTLRIVRDGPTVGVEDERVLRRARLEYGQLYGTLSREEREGLPAPDGLALPSGGVQTGEGEP